MKIECHDLCYRFNVLLDANCHKELILTVIDMDSNPLDVHVCRAETMGTLIISDAVISDTRDAVVHPWDT